MLKFLTVDRQSLNLRISDKDTIGLVSYMPH